MYKTYPPLIDRQAVSPTAFCSVCGGEIYPDELYYLDPDGAEVCQDCVTDWALARLRPQEA